MQKLLPNSWQAARVNVRENEDFFFFFPVSSAVLGTWVPPGHLGMLLMQWSWNSMCFPIILNSKFVSQQQCCMLSQGGFLYLCP